MIGYDVFVCTLGSRRKHGVDTFIKVDRDYPINFAVLAKDLNIPYYGLCTSEMANPDSMFLYMKTKGEAEEGVFR